MIISELKFFVFFFSLRLCGCMYDVEFTWSGIDKQHNIIPYSKKNENKIRKFTWNVAKCVVFFCVSSFVFLTFAENVGIFWRLADWLLSFNRWIFASKHWRTYIFYSLSFDFFFIDHINPIRLLRNRKKIFKSN